MQERLGPIDSASQGAPLGAWGEVAPLRPTGGLSLLHGPGQALVDLAPTGRSKLGTPYLPSPQKRGRCSARRGAGCGEIPSRCPKAFAAPPSTSAGTCGASLQQHEQAKGGASGPKLDGRELSFQPLDMHLRNRPEPILKILHGCRLVTCGKTSPWSPSRTAHSVPCLEDCAQRRGPCRHDTERGWP